MHFRIAFLCLALSACVTPGQDSVNSYQCEEWGFTKGEENHTICRQWLNNDTFAAEDNYMFAPKRTFPDFACLDYFKIPDGSPEYKTCRDKFKQIGLQSKEHVETRQTNEQQTQMDAFKQKCLSYGLKIGDPGYVDCMMKQEQQMKADAIVGAAFQMEQQKLEMQRRQQMQDNLFRQQELNRARVSPSNSMNCTTSYNRWGASTTCN